jgi:hypothetical protein
MLQSGPSGVRQNSAGDRLGVYLSVRRKRPVGNIGTVCSPPVRFWEVGAIAAGFRLDQASSGNYRDPGAEGPKSARVP